MLDHQLSDETLRLLAEAVATIGGRLAIYGRHNWAIEAIDGHGRLAFDPDEDSQFLRDELARVVDLGHF